MKRALHAKSRKDPRIIPLFYDFLDHIPTTAKGRIPLVWFKPLWRCDCCYCQYEGWFPSECCDRPTDRLYIDISDGSQVIHRAT